MDTKPINDEFRADNEQLRDCIKALIELSDSGSLAPHGIGGHARKMLAACYHRLPVSKPKSAAGLIGRLLCRCGKHKLATLRLDHNTLNGGRPSGALYECERCGEIQEWVAAWDQACCIGKWPSIQAFRRENSELNPQ